METLPPELDEVAECIGEFIRYWGFKKILGKIWTHLYLSEVPLDTKTLMKRLQVSKALMSISLRELLGYHVIVEVGKGPDGSQLYKANDDIAGCILAVLRRRERPMIARIKSATELIRLISSKEISALKLSSSRAKELNQLATVASLTLDGIVNLGSTKVTLTQLMSSVSGFIGNLRRAPNP